jgi:ketosteroid isomerase-like protein
VATADANLDLVRSIYTDWERGDFSRVDWADPEIEYAIADGPDPGTVRGFAAMTERAREQLRPAKDLKLMPQKIRELDDERVLVLIGSSARGKSSGVEIQFQQTHVLHVRDGKIARITVHYERAFADLGVEE